jgi:hypothetical protein
MQHVILESLKDEKDVNDAINSIFDILFDDDEVILVYKDLELLFHKLSPAALRGSVINNYGYLGTYFYFDEDDYSTMSEALEIRALRAKEFVYRSIALYWEFWDSRK